MKNINKSNAIIAGSIILAILVIFVLLRSFNSKWEFDLDIPADTPIADIPFMKVRAKTAIAAKMAQVFTPTSNSKIVSPVEITGQVVWQWYTGGTFPVELHDTNGNVIATSVVTVESTWKKKDFAPFTTTLSFPNQPDWSIGKIVLRNSNPSGELDSALEFSLSVLY